MPQTSFTVSSVSGGGSKTQDVTGVVDRMLITRISVDPSAGGDSWQFQLFGDDAYTATKKYYDSGAVSDDPAVDPIQNDDGTVTTFSSPNGTVCVYDDEDASGELHVKVTNNDASSRDFVCTIDWIPQLDGLGATELTLSSGAVTVTRSDHTLDTESDAATDDITTINGGYDQMEVTFRAANSARDVTFKNTGNMKLSGGTDFTFSNIWDTIKFKKVSSISLWLELTRSDNP